MAVQFELVIEFAHLPEVEAFVKYCKEKGFFQGGDMESFFKSNPQIRGDAKYAENPPTKPLWAFHLIFERGFNGTSQIRMEHNPSYTDISSRRSFIGKDCPVIRTGGLPCEFEPIPKAELSLNIGGNVGTLDSNGLKIGCARISPEELTALCTAWAFASGKQAIPAHVTKTLERFIR